MDINDPRLEEARKALRERVEKYDERILAVLKVLLPKGPRGRRIVPRRVLDDHAAVWQNLLVRRHVDIGKRRAAGLKKALLVPLRNVVVVSCDRHCSDSLDMRCNIKAAVRLQALPLLRDISAKYRALPPRK